MTEPIQPGNDFSQYGEDQAKRLLAGLQQQRTIYAVLQRLTEQQCDVMLSGQTEELLRLASSKDHELLRIESINVDIGEFKKSWRQWCHQVPELARSAVDLEMTELSEILRQLIDLDQKAEQAYRQQQETCIENLRRAEGSRRLKQAYGKPIVVSRGTLDGSH